jgi:hypothetical protein
MGNSSHKAARGHGPKHEPVATPTQTAARGQVAGGAQTADELFALVKRDALRFKSGDKRALTDALEHKRKLVALLGEATATRLLREQLSSLQLSHAAHVKESQPVQEQKEQEPEEQEGEDVEEVEEPSSVQVQVQTPAPMHSPAPKQSPALEAGAPSKIKAPVLKKSKKPAAPMPPPYTLVKVDEKYREYGQVVHAVMESEPGTCAWTRLYRLRFKFKDHAYLVAHLLAYLTNTTTYNSSCTNQGRRQVHIMCIEDGCPWVVRLHEVKPDGDWKVHKYVHTHKCSHDETKDAKRNKGYLTQGNVQATGIPRRVMHALQQHPAISRRQMEEYMYNTICTILGVPPVNANDVPLITHSVLEKLVAAEV